MATVKGTRAMKIALTTFSLSTKGGTQRQALALADAFGRLGHDTTLYTLRADYDRGYGDLMRRVSIVAVEPPPEADAKNPLARKLAHKRALEESARRIAEALPADLDVLNCQDDESYKVGYYYRRRTGRRDVVISWTMNDPPISYRPKPTFLFELGRRVWNVLELWYERRFLREIDTVFVLDRRNQDLVRRYYRRGSVIIGSGVDFSYFYHPVHRIEPGRPVRVLSIGIFARYRRFEDVIAAIGILRDRTVAAELDLVGDYAADAGYAAELTAQVARLSLGDRVHFRGRVSEKELLAYYHASDIFVFPNHMQTFGLAPAEAMAAGLPVIISRTSGFADFLTNGVEARIVEPLSPGQIADRIGELIDDPDRAFALATAGQRFVRETMTWKKRAEQMLAAR
jgi:glycosyltransferase involved in cell wall biosynthesis